MANMTVTNVDLGSVQWARGEFRDNLITFAGADVFAAGTILARDSVSGLLVPFVIGGVTNGNGVPVAVLTYPVEATAAGDIAGRVMITGVVRKERLVVDADGDASNITETVIDLLKSNGIAAVDVDDLSILDNQ